MNYLVCLLSALVLVASKSSLWGKRNTKGEWDFYALFFNSRQAAGSILQPWLLSVNCQIHPNGKCVNQPFYTLLLFLFYKLSWLCTLYLGGLVSQLKLSVCRSVCTFCMMAYYLQVIACCFDADKVYIHLYLQYVHSRRWGSYADQSLVQIHFL